MGFKKQLGTITTSLLLVAALMMPVVVQFLHIFEAHEHITCDKQTTHIHNDVPECKICDFHLASFNYDIAEYPNLLLSKTPVKTVVDFTSLQFHSFTITNKQLRAPPIFS